MYVTFTHMEIHFDYVIIDLRVVNKITARLRSENTVTVYQFSKSYSPHAIKSP